MEWKSCSLCLFFLTAALYLTYEKKNVWSRYDRNFVSYFEGLRIMELLCDFIFMGEGRKRNYNLH